MSAVGAPRITLSPIALGRLPVALGAAAILAQIIYPLTAGATRDALTMVTVALFCGASLTHAAVWRGSRAALAIAAVGAGGGLAVEAMGVATGYPFGAYTYTDTLPPHVLGVPWVVPLAWAMMAYPSLLVGRRITRSPLLGPIAAAAALAAWDLFLDPQMVAAGHWVWLSEGPRLLGIPLTNFSGWFVTALVMMVPLWRLVPDLPADDRVPLAMYLWTWAGSAVAHAFFLGLPGSALAGGVGMGAVVVLAFRPGRWHT